MTHFVETELLRIAYEVGGPTNGPAVFLLFSCCTAGRILLWVESM
jgi:hypothetical protein